MEEIIKDFRFIIVVSHRRSGTHWVIDSIFNNFRDVKHGYLNLHRLLPFHKDHLSVDEFRKHLRNEKVRILKTHSDGDFSIFRQFPHVYDFFKKEILSASKIIYINRDGRDILNSLFYYLRSMGINYPTFSEFLRSKNNFDNVSLNLNRVEFLKNHHESWDKAENKLELDYSDLARDYSDVIRRISSFLGMEHKNTIKNIELTKYNKICLGLRRLFPALFKTTAVLPREGKNCGWIKNFSDKDLDFYEYVMNKEERAAG